MTSDRELHTVWATALERSTRAVFRYRGLNPDTCHEDTPLCREVSWQAAAGLTAGLVSLVDECRRRGVTVEEIAAFALTEQAEIDRHHAERQFP